CTTARTSPSSPRTRKVRLMRPPSSRSLRVWSRPQAAATAGGRYSAATGAVLARATRSSLLGIDLEQLDVEDEHTLRPARLALVGHLLRDPEPGLVADDHHLQAVGPARDDAAQAELGRLAAGDRAVEHLAVGGPAAVVHLHPAGRRRVILAGALLEDLVEHA